MLVSGYQDASGAVLESRSSLSRGRMTGYQHPGSVFFCVNFLTDRKTASGSRIHIYPPEIYFLHFLVYHQVDDRN